MINFLSVYYYDNNNIGLLRSVWPITTTAQAGNEVGSKLVASNNMDLIILIRQALTIVAIYIVVKRKSRFLFEGQHTFWNYK